MHRQTQHPEPAVDNLNVLAYELNSLALKVAAQADALSRSGPRPAPPHADEAEVAAQMHHLIGELQRAARTLAYARRAGRLGDG